MEVSMAYTPEGMACPTKSGKFQGKIEFKCWFIYSQIIKFTFDEQIKS